jgi:pyrimidine operon attenuation protein/uracil phosphoribosyltransferase
MEGREINSCVVRIAHEIVERNKDLTRMVMVGIRTGGDFLAERLANEIKKIKNIDMPVGILDITLYRDDLYHVSHTPVLKKTEISFAIEGKMVILVDDVLYTGRTIRAALEGLMDFGRPKEIQLAVLIDRGHRELPIRADYVGKNLPTSREESVDVTFEEMGARDEVIIEKIKE